MFAAHTFIPSLSLGLFFFVNVENFSSLSRLQFFRKKQKVKSIFCLAHADVRTAQGRGIFSSIPTSQKIQQARLNMRCVYILNFPRRRFSLSHSNTLNARVREKQGKWKSINALPRCCLCYAILLYFSPHRVAREELVFLLGIYVKSCSFHFPPIKLFGCSATTATFSSALKNCSPGEVCFFVRSAAAAVDLNHRRQCRCRQWKRHQKWIAQNIWLSTASAASSFSSTCTYIHVKWFNTRPNALHLTVEEVKRVIRNCPHGMTQVCVAQIHKIKCHCLFIFILLLLARAHPASSDTNYCNEKCTHRNVNKVSWFSCSRAIAKTMRCVEEQKNVKCWP